MRAMDRVDFTKPLETRRFEQLARLLLMSLHEAARSVRRAGGASQMQDVRGNLFTRSDTMFGVCEGLGTDLGFPPNLLRITLGVMLLWNPTVTLGLYFGLGVVVFASRMLVRAPKARKAETAPAVADRSPAADNETLAEALAAAA
jgi:phage shock protein PspC (stress-responsive transcriptional regulator)